MEKIDITPEELTKFESSLETIIQEFEGLLKKCDKSAKIEYYEAGLAKEASEQMENILFKYCSIVTHYQRIKEAIIYTRVTLQEVDSQIAEGIKKGVTFLRD